MDYRNVRPFQEEKKAVVKLNLPSVSIVKTTKISYTLFNEDSGPIKWISLGILEENLSSGSVKFSLYKSFLNDLVIPPQVKSFISTNFYDMLNYTGPVHQSPFGFDDIKIVFIKVVKIMGDCFVITKQQSNKGERKVIYVQHNLSSTVNVPVAELRLKYIQ